MVCSRPSSWWNFQRHVVGPSIATRCMNLPIVSDPRRQIAFHSAMELVQTYYSQLIIFTTSKMNCKGTKAPASCNSLSDFSLIEWRAQLNLDRNALPLRNTSRGGVCDLLPLRLFLLCMCSLCTACVIVRLIFQRPVKVVASGLMHRRVVAVCYIGAICPCCTASATFFVLG